MPGAGTEALTTPGFWMDLASTGGLAAILKDLAMLLILPRGNLSAGSIVADETGAHRAMAGLCSRRACSNLACANISEASEADMGRGYRCSGCNTATYCGVGCQRQAWPEHKLVCSKLRDKALAPATGWIGLRAPGA